MKHFFCLLCGMAIILLCRTDSIIASTCSDISKKDSLGGDTDILNVVEYDYETHAEHFYELSLSKIEERKPITIFIYSKLKWKYHGGIYTRRASYGR